MWQSPLWDFAVEIYSKPDVENIVVALQDKYDANVNLILWCCWLQKEKIIVDNGCLPDVLIAVDAVSQQTVSKLREVRRGLKTVGMLTRVQVGLISRHILNAELALEKLLLQRLQDYTLKHMVGHADGSVDKLGLAYYLTFIDIPDAERIAHQLLIKTHALSV